MKELAFDSENGFVISDGPYLYGGASSPVGLDYPTDTIYFQTTASGVLIWRKFGAGVNDWRRLSAQDIPFSPVTGITATDTQAAIEVHGSRHSVDGVDPTVLVTTTAQTTGATTTTSTEFTQLSDMTITPAAGNYLVFFSTTATNGTNNAIVYARVTIAGTTQAGSEVSTRRGSQIVGATLSINGYPVTVNGAQAIQIFWRVTAGTGTAHDARHLTILRVS